MRQSYLEKEDESIRKKSSCVLSLYSSREKLESRNKLCFHF